MKNEELAKIVKHVLKNKEKYFEELFHVIVETIYYTSYRILNDSYEAEDATQEIILYIYEHLEDVRSPKAFNQWMNRVIVGKCNHITTKFARVKESLTMEEFDNFVEEESEFLPEKFVESKEKRELIIKIITDLPVKQKEVILMYYYQDMTAVEIAKALNKSLPAVKDRILNARKSIRSRLEQMGELEQNRIYSISGISILAMILKKDSGICFTSQIKQGIWDYLQINAQPTSESNKISGRNKDYLNDHVKKNKYLILLVLLLLFLGVDGVYTAYSHFLSPVYPRNNSQELTQGDMESEIPFVAESESLFDDSDINNDQKDTQKLEEIDESSQSYSSSESDSKLSRTYVFGEEILPLNTSIDDKNSEEQSDVILGPSKSQPFSNQAYAIDEDLKDLEYEESIDGSEKGDSLYSGDEYKTSSNSTYHQTEEPILEIMKEVNISNEKVIKDEEVLNYTITIKNIGRVPAYHVVITDIIPNNTEYITDSIKSSMETETILDDDQIFWNQAVLKQSEILEVQFQVRIINSEEKKNIVNTAQVKVMNNKVQVSSKSIKDKRGFVDTNTVIYKRDFIHSPKTGDGTKLIFVSVMLIGSCLIILTLYRKKHN